MILRPMNALTHLELDTPLDMHLHLRDGDMLELVAPLSAETFSAAVIMAWRTSSWNGSGMGV